MHGYNYYRTSDLALAAVLSIYYPIDEINRKNPTKAIFVFRKGPDFDEYINSYWNHTLKVDPQTYFNQLKAIKNRLYSER